MRKYKYILYTHLLSTILLFVSCEKVIDLRDSKANPVSVFNELWSEIDKRYALFSIKQVNWSLVYEQYNAKISDQMSSRELFTEMTKMLETLKDGHVALISENDTSGYDNFYKLYPVNFNWLNIQKNYLKNDYKSTGPFIYKVVDNVGYIYYASFADDYRNEELDKMMEELSTTKGLIIDVRKNPGGKSYNVDRLAQKFIQEKKLVKFELYKNGFGHNDFAEPKAYYLQPVQKPYLNPVILLTNRSCYSACNDFASYMSGLPNILLYGDQTGGGGAIPLDYVLANGWKIQYSASVTLSPDKVNIENGIIPDLNLFISSINEVNGIDPILERAFLTLK